MVKGIVEFFRGLEWAERIFLISTACSVSTILLDQNLNNAFLAIMGISWFFVPKKQGWLRNGAGDIWVILCWVFYLIYLIGMLYTENLQSGFSQLETKLGMMIFPFLISSYGNWDRRRWKVILATMGIALLILALVSLVAALIKSYESTGSILKLDSRLIVYDRLTDAVGIQPLYFSLFIIFCMLAWQLILIENWKSYSSAQRLTILAGEFFLLGFLFLLSSRTSVITYFIWAFLRTVILIIRDKKWKMGLFPFFIEIFLGLVLLTQLEVNKTRFSEAIDPQSDFKTDQFAGRSLRIEKWKCALDSWKKEPFLGVGTGDENAVLMECFKSRNIEEAIRWGYNSHNQYLSTLTQVGILGLISLMALVAYPLLIGFKKQNLMVFSAGLIFMLCIGSETMLSRRFGVLFCAITLSIWFVGQARITKDSSEHNR